MAGENEVRMDQGLAASLRRKFLRYEDAFGEIRDEVQSIVTAIEDGSTEFTAQMGDAPATFGLSWEDAALRVERSCQAVRSTLVGFSTDLSALESRHSQ